ncbi:hypothetical protein PENSOL_c020G11542 [Penicillium solitum]|uniref:Uncharacterized protein n=1 Tax=Penicillium solitum TaxID=60172 RepID=A0A1V6R2H0_9EURO|nr:uncharacterized protein PENSOL_c020G11542 [Penicillium solitum]OQD95432.1 hypothetical protein PENSOL_c020G11542 [Penicillium solitum]
MRKAAERVVAQLDGDEGGWRASNRPNETSLSVNMRKAAGRVRFGDVSVCERAEGSRACGGSIGVVTGLVGGYRRHESNRSNGTSLSVIARKAAERVVASSFGFQGKGWRTSLSVNVRKAAGRVVARLFGKGRSPPVEDTVETSLFVPVVSVFIVMHALFVPVTEMEMEISGDGDGAGAGDSDGDGDGDGDGRGEMSRTE